MDISLGYTPRGPVDISAYPTSTYDQNNFKNVLAIQAYLADNTPMSKTQHTIPAHEVDIEFLDPDEGCFWRMRVRCLGDSYDNFVILQAQRDEESAETSSPQNLFALSDLGKWLKTCIQAEIERNWLKKSGRNPKTS